jgi:NAD(P)H dehydrogenase (quinone)
MTTSAPLIGVTGSTGQLGGRVAARLAALGQPQRLLVRDLARAPQLPCAETVQASYEDGPAPGELSARHYDPALSPLEPFTTL